MKTYDHKNQSIHDRINRRANFRKNGWKNIFAIAATWAWQY